MHAQSYDGGGKLPSFPLNGPSTSLGKLSATTLLFTSPRPVARRADACTSPRAAWVVVAVNVMASKPVTFPRTKGAEFSGQHLGILLAIPLDLDKANLASCKHNESDPRQTGVNPTKHDLIIIRS